MNEKKPIIPPEKLTVYQFEIEGSPAIATINTGYDCYPNKADYPWLGLVTFEIKDRDENGHPTDNEAVILKGLEEKITEFLNESQTAHYIGRVNRNGEQDVFYYLNTARLNAESTQEFFNSVYAIRPMNFITENDPEWKCVEAFLK